MSRAFELENQWPFGQMVKRFAFAECFDWPWNDEALVACQLSVTKSKLLFHVLLQSPEDKLATAVPEVVRMATVQ